MTPVCLNQNNDFEVKNHLKACRFPIEVHSVLSLLVLDALACLVLSLGFRFADSGVIVLETKLSEVFFTNFCWLFVSFSPDFWFGNKEVLFLTVTISFGVVTDTLLFNIERRFVGFLGFVTFLEDSNSSSNMSDCSGKDWFRIVSFLFRVMSHLN